VGGFELFGTDRVRAIRDLKGKSLAVTELGGPDHVFLATMVAYVGLDPGKDIHWATHPPAEAVQVLTDGKIDAFLAFAPFPPELRAEGIGCVMVNSAVDRPWSQYFCCMVAGNPAFVRKHPVATKRALRAILKATDLCALEPERVGRFLVDRGFAQSYEYALQTMRDIPYGRWREYDPEDSVRFYALRLHEVGMIKSNPQKIIAQSTDWRFLHELQKELKRWMANRANTDSVGSDPDARQRHGARLSGGACGRAKLLTRNRGLLAACVWVEPEWHEV
jgi:NitT/TauT family transport system substrate-binding protein